MVFGRQVYNMNSDNSELALVKLMELFDHNSVAITKRYLGLRQEEILQVNTFPLSHLLLNLSQFRSSNGKEGHFEHKGVIEMIFLD